MPKQPLSGNRPVRAPSARKPPLRAEIAAADFLKAVEEGDAAVVSNYAWQHCGARDDSDRTTLHLAALAPNQQVGQLLLKRCIDATVNATDKRLATPLHAAAEHGKADMCAALLKRASRRANQGMLRFTTEQLDDDPGQPIDLRWNMGLPPLPPPEPLRKASTIHPGRTEKTQSRSGCTSHRVGVTSGGIARLSSRRFLLVAG